MASALKNQKFSLLFDWFDQDGDGQLTQGDLRATATVFAAVATDGNDGDNGNDTNVTAIHAAFERWWQLLLRHADTDGDGQVSRQEFTTTMEANVTTPEHFEGAVMAIADAVMDAADTDGDGVLSRDEYIRMYSVLGVPPEHTGPAFALLDLDGNGVISLDEFRGAIADFYLSNDPDAPGNFLLGPIGRAS